MAPLSILLKVAAPANAWRPIRVGLGFVTVGLGVICVDEFLGAIHQFLPVPVINNVIAVGLDPDSVQIEQIPDCGVFLVLVRILKNQPGVLIARDQDLPGDGSLSDKIQLFGFSPHLRYAVIAQLPAGSFLSKGKRDSNASLDAEYVVRSA